MANYFNGILKVNFNPENGALDVTCKELQEAILSGTLVFIYEKNDNEMLETACGLLSYCNYAEDTYNFRVVFANSSDDLALVKTYAGTSADDFPAIVI